MNWVPRELSFRSGGVEVFTSDAEREVWRVPPGSASSIACLLELGAAGVGGFETSGSDEHGDWLGRRVGGESLAQLWARSEPDWRGALSCVGAIARALAACEERGLWPGPLHPANVRVDAAQGKLDLRAEALVAAELGMEAPAVTQGSTATRWTSPEQNDGAAWDAATNRYVLGLCLYRLLALEHPIQGQGLRLGFEQLSVRGPAPFPESRARVLPPGLQGYCLGLLDPDPARRPATAAEIASKLAAFADGRAAEVGSPAAGTPAPARPRARPTTAGQPARSSPGGRARDPAPPVSRFAPPAPRRFGFDARSAKALAWAAPVLGGMLLLWALGSAESSPARPRTTPRAPLAAHDLGPESCESCHPRQTAEWRRSVMAHSVKSPMFLALEAVIEEQGGRSSSCAHGAGIMRKSERGSECRDPNTGLVLTGSAGEHWCVNCHAPGENSNAVMPPWDARAQRSASRAPLDSLLPSSTLEGISCAFCHQVAGPVAAFDPRSRVYAGNPSWVSPVTGQSFTSRPEDLLGLLGIANSGYWLDPNVLLGESDARARVPSGVHGRVPEATGQYLRSSEFCGACHDVRLFGTDVVGSQKGEHFKRLRNAYSEWRDWARDQKRAGRPAYSCQDCHMSRFPGACLPGPEPPSAGAGDRGSCPPGTHFEAAAPGAYPEGTASVAGGEPRRVSPHYFSGVDVPLAPEFPEHLIDSATIDEFGIPLGARQRRDLLLARSVRMTIGEARILGRDLEVPLTFENVGAGHRIPAGFSQERELWLHLRITDQAGRLVYEVGNVARGDEDLHDKVFLQVNTDERSFDPDGRPLGVFGADVADGPDVPLWSPDPALGGTEFRGRGLVNFQNGFLRCVVCIGTIDAAGRCQPLPGQESARADRFSEGGYDIDTGRCSSNLSGPHALFETYFPVGSLDARRGVLKAPDAIIDTRSLPPNVPIHYTYSLGVGRGSQRFRIEARLLFRAFPPFLLKAFVDYEARQDRRGLRPRGPLIDARALERLEVVELDRKTLEVRR